MRRILVGAIVLSCRFAFADDTAARAKKMFEAQTASRIADDDGKGFDATLAKDAIVDEQQDLMTPSEAKIGKPKVAWFGACGAASAEVSMRAKPHPEGMEPGKTYVVPARPWHFLSLVTADGTDYKASALAWFVAAPDKELPNGVMNYIAKLAAEPSPTQLMTWLAQPAELAKHLAKDPAVTVFGTQASDRAYGQAAGKKLLARWAKLKLEVVKKDQESDEEKNREVVVGDCAAAAVNLRMPMKNGSIQGFILLRGFVVAHKSGDAWEILSVGYAPNDFN